MDTQYKKMYIVTSKTLNVWTSKSVEFLYVIKVNNLKQTDNCIFNISLMVITKQIPIVDAQNINSDYHCGKNHLITKVHHAKEEERNYRTARQQQNSNVS